MTREHKLALIVGFSLVLVLGVLISDHFSKARNAQMAEDIKMPTPREMGATTPGVRMMVESGPGATAPSSSPPTEPRKDLVELPGVAHPAGGDAGKASGSQLALGGSPSIPLMATRSTLLAPNGEEHNDPPGTVTPPPAMTPQIPITRYDVKEGDTLYRIASKVYSDGKLWEKIRDYNKDKVGSGGGLHEGVTLLLPPKDVLLGKPYTAPVGSGSPAANTPSLSGGTTKPEIKPAGDYKEYVVKEGDTLVGIARKMLNSGKRYAEIIEANKGTLADPESLTVGMKLRVPSK